jgi:hypothetical protein
VLLSGFATKVFANHNQKSQEIHARRIASLDLSRVNNENRPQSS